MHDARTGKTQRLAGEAFKARPQGEVLALDLLHGELPHCVLRGREMPPIDTRLVCVIPGEAKGRQHGAEFQKHRILPSPNDVGEPSPSGMVKCMPQPPRSPLSADETPHFIERGGASRRDADGA